MEEFSSFVKDLARIMVKHRVVIESRPQGGHYASTHFVIAGKDPDIQNAWEIFDAAQEETQFKYISDTQNEA